MQKSLDRKLAAIHADPHRCREFILADAKDADMAFGIAATGQPPASPESHAAEIKFRTLEEYREQMRIIARSELVDILLMSASTCEQLAIVEGLFENSPITPAARANDTTDVHVVRGGKIHTAPSHPFRSASLDHIQCGHLDCEPFERQAGADLGLYSITFNNDPERDRFALEQFKLFREEAERKGFRYFLEIFDPNVQNAVPPELLGGFINDIIVRTLAGVANAGRPLFLKIVYHGPRAMEELVRYDDHLIVGVLGGSAGTTRDAFQLLHDAKKYGARVALFGRKINQAENQLAFVNFLRLIADEQLEPEEAVRAYHSVLQKLGIPAHRKLADDLLSTTGSMSYGGEKTISLPVAPPAEPIPAKTAEIRPAAPAASSANPPAPAPAKAAPAAGSSVSAPAKKNRALEGAPDFKSMTADERYAYHQERLKKMFGG